MKATGHTIHDVSIEFKFADGHCLVVAGGRTNDTGGLDSFKHAILLKGEDVVGRYLPRPAKSPNLRLIPGYDKETFLAYWREALSYFDSKINTILCGAMRRGDVYYMRLELGNFLPIIQDNRRSQVGPLS